MTGEDANRMRTVDGAAGARETMSSIQLRSPMNGDSVQNWRPAIKTDANVGKHMFEETFKNIDDVPWKEDGV